MTAGQFFTYLLFVLASMPLLAFLANWIIKIYFVEKTRWMAQVLDAVAKRIKEMKGDGQHD